MKTADPGSVENWGEWPVVQHTPPLLFNLETDPAEKYNVAKEHPDVLRVLNQALQRHRRGLQPVQPQR